MDLVLDRGTGQLGGQGTDEDLAGFRVLLQPGGNVDDVASDEELLAVAHGRDDLARVDADPCLEVERDLVVEGADRGLDRQRRPNGPLRVVVVDAGDAEDGHRRVADELLDGAAVRLHDRADLLEVRGPGRTGRLPGRCRGPARWSRRGRRRGR